MLSQQQLLPVKSASKPACQAVPHIVQMRRQHVTNLMALMRQYTLQRNVPRLAQVVAQLLEAQVRPPCRRLKGEAYRACLGHTASSRTS